MYLCLLALFRWLMQPVIWVVYGEGAVLLALEVFGCVWVSADGGIWICGGVPMFFGISMSE
jgi:hypothetical protein